MDSVRAAFRARRRVTALKMLMRRLPGLVADPEERRELMRLASRNATLARRLTRR